MKYSVLLLYPDYISDSSETYYSYADADSPEAAVKDVREQAAEDNEVEDASDFKVILVLEGEHRDINPEYRTNMKTVDEIMALVDGMANAEHYQDDGQAIYFRNQIEAALKEREAPPKAQPLSSEKEIAIWEGHFNQDSDEYFNARPQFESSVNHRIFYAGHRKGWLAGLGHKIGD